MTGFSVAVEAVSTMTEILSDDVLTRGGRWTLMPAGRTLIHVCTPTHQPFHQLIVIYDNELTMLSKDNAVSFGLRDMTRRFRDCLGR